MKLQSSRWVRATSHLSTALAAVVALAVLSLSATAVAAAAQGGTISGTVREQASRAPVPAAQVYIVGTGFGAQTDADGKYTIRDAPVGQHELRARRIGYQESSVTVVVSADSAVVVDLDLVAAEAVLLSQTVVTATGVQQRREIANAVADIGAAEVVKTAPVTDVSDLLTSRAPGVQVDPGAGTTGAGSRIRVRGSSSVSLANGPLIYVDGVRIGSSENASSLNLGGQTTSRLGDVNPDDIESIEIVKGPSAATLYGTQAANGVIRIITKRGRRGTTTNLWFENGRVSDESDYPEVFRAVDASGKACPIVSVGLGSCTQAEVQHFNLLQDPSTRPFRTGNRLSLGGSVAGAGDEFNYFVSGERESEDGVTENNYLRKTNLRGNFGARPRSDLTLDVSSGFVSSKLRLPNNDNSSLGLMGQALLGSVPAEWWRFTPEQIFQIESLQEIMRFTGGANATWQPLTWLSARASTGLDLTNQKESQYIPVGVINRGLEILGVREANRSNGLNVTMEFSSTAKFELNDRVTSESSVGVQYFSERRDGTFARAEQLTPGANSLTGAAVTRARESTVESKTMGAFIQEQVGVNDRLFLTAAARWDDNSAFGKNFDLVVYPKVSASWVLSEEPFFPAIGALQSLRLRAAWGQSGNQPGVTDALLYLRGVSVTTPNGSDAVGVTFDGGGLGNPDLKPERSSEIEAGLDAALWDGRVGLELTYYDKNTRDALVFRDLPPSLGMVLGRFENIGRVQNRGVEASVNTRILSGRELGLDLTVMASHNENKLVVLGEGIAPIAIPDGNARHVPGFPLGGYWDLPILGYDDANGDGILVPNEVNVGDTAVYIGSPTPSTDISISPRLRFFDSRVILSALLSHRSGNRLFNNTAAFRCGRANDRTRNDPGASLDDQARCVASAFKGTNAGYIEDASFTKLREMSLTLVAPGSLAGRIGADQLSVTLSGRNLATWTGYTGVDPESNRLTAGNFGNAEFLTQPAVRYWTVRFNVQF